MNEQRVGIREVKTICWSKVQGGLFARWQMGGLAGATPLIWTSSVSPRMSITGGWAGVVGGKYVIGGPCPSTRIPSTGHSGNESARQLPTVSDPPWWWGHIRLSKFQIIENLIDLSPLQLSQCDDGGHLDYNIARFVFLFSSLFCCFWESSRALAYQLGSDSQIFQTGRWCHTPYTTWRFAQANVVQEKLV